MKKEVYLKQCEVADRTKEFLNTWGLKQRFVAETCMIDVNIFSKFMNHAAVLSEKQINRLTIYLDDYVRRNT